MKLLDIKLIFLFKNNGDGILSEEIYLWDHGEIEKMAESIIELDE